MTRTQKTPVASPLNLPLLKSESTDEYLGVLERLTTEIKPKGIVEQFYVEDMASLIFEIRRLQRCKVSLINIAELEAVRNLLNQSLPEPAILFSPDTQEKVAALARDWFVKKSAKQEVLTILQSCGLDASAIEAEAIRLKSADLESIERMLALARSRFDRSLRSVSDYKESVARRLRQSSAQMLQGEEMPVLEYAADQRSAA
jgi:hypothetical protein